MDPFLDEYLEPRWTRYGLRGDPYWSNALDPEAETTRPITLFRGRQEERRRLVQSVLDGEHSATLLHAAGGHGKTTLANAAAYGLGERDHLVLPEEIQYTGDGGTTAFFGEILRGILQALSDRGITLPGPNEATTNPLAEARHLVHLMRARTGWSGGAEAFGTGAQAGVQYEFLRPVFEPTASKRLLDAMLKAIGALDLELAGVVVRVNNLDVAATTDPEGLQAFLLEVRDLFQIDGMHWLLMGNDVVRDLIEDEPRVGSVFENPLALGPFTVQDVHDILEARYSFLALPGRDVKPPADPDLIEALHAIHYGDLRNTLRDLRRAVQAVDPVEAEPVTQEQALPLLEDIHYEHLAKRIRPEGWQTLAAMEDAGEPVRQKDLAGSLGVTEATISNRFKNLQANRVIELVRSQGRSQFWRLPGHVRLALAGARRADESIDGGDARDPARWHGPLGLSPRLKARGA